MGIFGTAPESGKSTPAEAKSVGKSYPTTRGVVHALRDFSLEVQERVPLPGGPVGLRQVDIPSHRRRSGARHHGPPRGATWRTAGRPLSFMVFQEYAVFPWKTVLENVAFGLQIRGVSQAERQAVAMDWIERVGLRRFAHHYPPQLSGGMRQRVGIDAQTRTILQEELRRLWEESRQTVVYVTHSIMVGVRDIDPVYLEAGRNYGANRWQLLRHVIVPGATPVIFAGLRLALGTALIVIIAVEFVRAKTGVGFLTFYYWEILAPEKMYAGLLVVMLLGVLLTIGLQWLERLVMPWRREPDSHTQG
jgi:NitT/TauT family transport system ATP-binding protein